MRSVRGWLAGLALSGLFAMPGTGVAAERTLGVSMHFMRDDYAVRLVGAIEESAAGARVIVTDANADAAKQLSDIENLVVQGVDVIIVVPIDEKAILPGIRRANAAGIPVVAVTHIPGAEVLTTVGATGDYANGRASGELLREATGGKGQVAMIGIPYSLWRIDERERGFLDAIDGSGLEVTIRQSGLDQSRVQDIVSGILIAKPDIAAIWCAFSNQLVGAADALRTAGRHNVVLTGIDADEAIIQRIRQGWITGAAAQFPSTQGRLAAEAALAHLDGRPVEDSYEVPVGVVTPDNLDEMRTRIWGD
jgi:ribose transport system substrate-binding protein